MNRKGSLWVTSNTRPAGNLIPCTVREMVSDIWARIRNDLDDPDDRRDPWASQSDPGLDEVYRALLRRRMESV
jgi:hypothetical protein